MLDPNAFSLVYSAVVAVPHTIIKLQFGRDKVSSKNFYPTPFMGTRDHVSLWAETQVMRKSWARRGRDPDAGDDINFFNR